MGKTTNILDLNNRLEKVEKENVAQNNYNSLKNRPKINGNLLTGDKTGTQLGLAEAQDIGDLSALTTTDKSSCVGAINEVNGKVGNLKPNLIQLVNTNNVPTTASSYSCNWNNYDLLLISVAQYNNRTGSLIVDKNYFSTTDANRRVIIKDDITDVTFAIYNNGTDAVMIRATSVSDSATVIIHGVTISA